jgi:hypothetical protein
VRATRVEGAAPQRLAWAGDEELVLWQPSTEAERALSPSIFAATPARVVWRAAALPAALDRGAAGKTARTSPRRPLEPADLDDETDARWQGRSFELERSLHPVSGLPRDGLSVGLPDGGRRAFELPGEACGGARFGRPQHRIEASGRAGLDLRFVGGGCHAVRVDLEDGSVSRLDRAQAPAVCRSRRHVPPGTLAAALRGWTLELRQALERAGADPEAAHTLEIGTGGATRALARDFAGAPVAVVGPAFPIQTPLRRIDVTQVAGREPAPAARPPANAGLAPL